MNKEELKKQTDFINRELVGKTIAGAEAEEPWPRITIILIFTDGTKCQITSEEDEGFRFSVED